MFLSTKTEYSSERTSGPIFLVIKACIDKTLDYLLSLLLLHPQGGIGVA